jgi:serine/threonine protein kinase
VALKRLLPGLRGDPLQQRKLRREAQIGAALKHENIVRALELIDLGDEVALAMELVDGLPGQRLLTLLTEHGYRLRPPLVGHILFGLFSALHYLQSLKLGPRPLVHADLSLENVMLARDGKVRLIDFGLSAEDGTAAEVSSTDDVLTALHEVGGKPSYVPPEGMPRIPTVASDLYAAGVCAWELLAGRRFPVLPKGTGKRELGSVVAFAASGQPAPVWLLLRDCLALAPTERLRSAEQGLELCARLRNGHPTEAALAKLVRSLQSAGPDWQAPEALLPQLYRFEPAVELADRLRQAFAAQQVEVVAVQSAEQPNEPSLAMELSPLGGRTQEPRFVERARQGQGRSRPPDSLLREASRTGIATSEDGLLCLRTRLPGIGEHVVIVDPGPGCRYSPTALALLRSLLS